jgi:hypothetical protein
MGLYDDDKAAVTSGDLLDVCYWQTKFAALKLEAALKSRQPEWPIRLLVADVINSCTDLLRTYPGHEDVMGWRDHAREIEKKIDPNAPSADFKSNFAQWRDYSYESGWRFYHLAGMAAADDDRSLALSYAREGIKQLERTVERMAEWPAEVQEWVTAALAELRSLEAKGGKA